MLLWLKARVRRGGRLGAEDVDGVGHGEEPVLDLPVAALPAAEGLLGSLGSRRWLDAPREVRSRAGRMLGGRSEDSSLHMCRWRTKTDRKRQEITVSNGRRRGGQNSPLIVGLSGNQRRKCWLGS